MSAQPLPAAEIPARRPNVPVSLSEAARRFKELGRGPSRATLSRAATDGHLKGCLSTDRRQRALYVFDKLCAYYGVNPDPKVATTAGRSRRAAANEPLVTSATGLASADLDAILDRFAQMQQQLDSMRELVLAATRDGRDLSEVRKTLMLKYDSENGHLRQRLEAAEERVRQAAAFDGLAREVSTTRQAISRLTDLVQQRLPEPARS